MCHKTVRSVGVYLSHRLADPFVPSWKGLDGGVRNVCMQMAILTSEHHMVIGKYILFFEWSAGFYLLIVRGAMTFQSGQS